MSIVLYRVDERLIHGQVVLGWGSQLRPARFLVVDDGLAESEWEQELFALGAGRAETLFMDVEAARLHLAEWRSDDVRSILLTRDVRTMVRLAEGRRLEGERINLGGLHHGPGRERVLSYLYLTEEDRRHLRQLEDEGTSISAQDLPDASKVSLKSLLGS
jgi:PTS system mannose-specific IIB component/fructoselysine and glucoselysine-specific PTS system IIB component